MRADSKDLVESRQHVEENEQTQSVNTTNYYK